MARIVALSGVALFLATLVACADNATPPGVDLGGAPAADFRLVDTAGRSVALADHRNRVVALTFLYTECPDVCPVIARRLAQALDGLGEDAEDVAVLAVSVDPDGDTSATATAFMEKHGLAGPNRHYLLGDAATLAPVWLAYGVASAPIQSGGTPGPGASLPIGRIGHTDAIYLIDREGRKRTLLRGDATVEEIRAGLKRLLR